MFNWFTQAGPIMYPLAACSLISLTITIERLIFWARQSVTRDQNLISRIIELVATGDIPQARKIASPSDDRMARVITRALSLTNSPDTIESALKQAADLEISRMSRFLRILDTIVTISPLLGILGTVVGIISSFDVLGTTGVDNPMAATSGIAQALLTTAVGLVIAMITLIPYNYFLAKVDHAVNELETQLTHFQSVYRKGSNNS